MKMDLIKICLVFYLFSSSLSDYVGQGTIFGQLDAEVSHCGLHRSIYETPFHVAFNTYNNEFSHEDPPLVENQGFYKNGANCGRWIKLTIGKHCIGTNLKFCEGTEINDIWTGESIFAIGYDSCSNDGWCRTDPNHLDISSQTIEEVGGQVLVNKWNYQTYCQNKPNFIIQPEDAERIEGTIFKQKLLDGTLCNDPANFKKSKDELKKLGNVLNRKWNTRLISWNFIESPNYTGDVIIYASPYGNKWGQLTLFSHLKNGLTKAQRLFNGAEWRDGQRCGLCGLCYLFQVDSGEQTTTIRIYDANGNLYPNEYTYFFQPDGTYKQLAYTTKLINGIAPQTTITPNPTPDPTTSTTSTTTTQTSTTQTSTTQTEQSQTQQTTFSLNQVAGQLTNLQVYDKRDWLHCGIQQNLIETKFIVSLARQNTKGTTDQNLNFPISDDKVGAYNNGKNCGRWIKVTLGDQCDQTNWGQGCNNQSPDKFSGKNFYAKVADACWVGEVFCGTDPNAIKVSQDALKQVGDQVLLNWNNRQVKWEFVKNPTQAPIKIYFGANSNPWWLPISFLNEINGISSVQRKIDSQWVDAQRQDDLGGVWLLPGRGNIRNFQIRFKDIDGLLFQNEFIFKYSCPMDSSKGYQVCTTPIEVADLQLVAPGYEEPIFNLNNVPGKLTNLQYYTSRDWLHCGIPIGILNTKYFASLARQNTQGTTKDNLKYPINAEQIGSYDNGKNCGRWVKVTLGNQCGKKNWGDGCQDQFQDEFSGKSFYAMVSDACWVGEVFCGNDPNAIEVSAEALGQVGSGVLSQWNNRQVKWEFVENPNNDPVKIYFGANANQWWLPVHILNVKNGISKVQRYVNSKWQDAARQDDLGGTWLLPGAGNIDSFQIMIFDINGVQYNGNYNFNFPCPQNLKNERVCTEPKQATIQ